MKKKFAVGLSSMAVLSGLIVGGVMATTGSANNPTPPDLTPQVVAQQTQIDNHDARLTNVEADVKDLQDNTETPARVVRVEVPVAQPTPPITEPTRVVETQPEPQPQPVLITQVDKIPIENSEDIDCRYTYSDGTTHQWHWQTVTFNQVKLTTRHGSCANSDIGTIGNRN